MVVQDNDIPEVADDEAAKAPTSRPAASTTATVARPMSASAAKRAQPQRQARSKRGKR
jgi:hypothetical protein